MCTSDDHVHDWQPDCTPSRVNPNGGHLEPDDMNLRVCVCGEVGWLVPAELSN